MTIISEFLIDAFQWSLAQKVSLLYASQLKSQFLSKELPDTYPTASLFTCPVPAAFPEVPEGSKNSKPAHETQKNAAAQFPETGLK